MFFVNFWQAKKYFLPDRVESFMGLAIQKNPTPVGGQFFGELVNI
jgi:hypothetical protein